MRTLKLGSFALAGLLASALIAGCSGGSKSSLPPAQPQVSSKTVGVTLTFLIANSTQSAARSPKFIPNTTQSIVIKYQGDTGTAPSNLTPPSTAPTAGTVNVTATATNPPPPGQCTGLGAGYQCTVSVAIPVGVLDIYILAYSGPNGTGTLLASSVTVAQVNPNGSLTSPGTQTGVTIVPLTQNITLPGSTVTLNAIVPIVPTGAMPNPAATPTSFPNNAGPFAYSAAGTVTLMASDGSTIAPNSSIAPLKITDGDAGGASCLVYIKAGATTATPCPMSSSPSSVTLVNSSDTYAILYNSKYVPAGTLTITAALPSPAPTPTPVPLSVTITPTTAYNGTVAFATYKGPTGQIVYDPLSKKVYVGAADPVNPLYAVSYSSTTGYSTPSPVAVKQLNGVTATQLSGTGASYSYGGAQGVIVGPDNNIWFAETAGHGATQYIAVYVVNSPVVNPLNGTIVNPGPGVFVEYTLYSNAALYSTPKGLITYHGYVYAFDYFGELWRINPASGAVNPNLAVAYSPGQTPTYAQELTDATGSNQTNLELYSNVIALNGSLWFGDDNGYLLAKINPDTNAVPSAGLCTPAGPPPCIGTYVLAPTAAVSTPRALYTDGTSVYVADGDGNLFQYNPSTLVQTKANTGFQYTLSGSEVDGGLIQTSDGWFWSLGENGGMAVMGMVSTTPGPVTAYNAACYNSDYPIQRGGTAFIVGPDGSLLYSPSWQEASSPLAAVCAIVY